MRQTDTTFIAILNRMQTNNQTHDDLTYINSWCLRPTPTDPTFPYLFYTKTSLCSLKSFRIYILHAKVFAYVPSASVKDVLTHPDIDGKRAKWIAKLIDFNIEVKPTKLVKGQGLAKLLTE